MWIKPSSKVGISEPYPTAKFEVLETNPVIMELGGSYGKLLSSFRAKIQTIGNDMKHNDWIYKATANMNGWEDFAFHDGLAVDGSYLTPGIDTRTWWERLPGQQMQLWGDQANTHLKLAPNFMQIMEQPNATNTSVLNLNVYGGNAFEIFDQSTQKVNFNVLATGNTNIGRQANSLNSSMLNVNINGGNAFEIFDQSSQKVNFNILATGKTNIGQQANTLNTSMLNVNLNGGSAFEIFDQSNQKINFLVKADGQTFIGPKKVNPNAAASIHANALVQIYGKAACTELIVIDPIKWADYVFEKNYKPLPLNQLETYYITNKHLPEVPTAQDVAEKGIEVGQMNALLLKKVEELTLYVVELSKKIEALEENKKQK